MSDGTKKKRNRNGNALATLMKSAQHGGAFALSVKYRNVRDLAWLDETTRLGQWKKRDQHLYDPAFNDAMNGLKNTIGQVLIKAQAKSAFFPLYCLDDKKQQYRTTKQARLESPSSPKKPTAPLPPPNTQPTPGSSLKSITVCFGRKPIAVTTADGNNQQWFPPISGFVLKYSDFTELEVGIVTGTSSQVTLPLFENEYIDNLVQHTSADGTRIIKLGIATSDDRSVYFQEGTIHIDVDGIQMMHDTRCNCHTKIPIQDRPLDGILLEWDGLHHKIASWSRVQTIRSPLKQRSNKRVKQLERSFLPVQQAKSDLTQSMQQEARRLTSWYSHSLACIADAALGVLLGWFVNDSGRICLLDELEDVSTIDSKTMKPQQSTNNKNHLDSWLKREENNQETKVIASVSFSTPEKSKPSNLALIHNESPISCKQMKPIIVQKGEFAAWTQRKRQEVRQQQLLQDEKKRILSIRSNSEREQLLQKKNQLFRGIQFHLGRLPPKFEKELQKVEDNFAAKEETLRHKIHDRASRLELKLHQESDTFVCQQVGCLAVVNPRLIRHGRRCSVPNCFDQATNCGCTVKECPTCFDMLCPQHTKPHQESCRSC